MTCQGFGKTFTGFHARADIADGIAHDFVWRLIGQRLQGLDDGDTGINHRGELAGEDDEVVKRHLTAFGLAALGGFLADFHDQQIAVEQRSDGGLFGGGLFGGGLDGVANLAAGGRFPGGVGKEWHTFVRE